MQSLGLLEPREREIVLIVGWAERSDTHHSRTSRSIDGRTCMPRLRSTHDKVAQLLKTKTAGITPPPSDQIIAR